MVSVSVPAGEPEGPKPVTPLHARAVARLAALCAAVAFWAWQAIEVLWGPFLFD